MTSMFWGLRLEPGKRYTTTVDKSFHVSMAALDCGTVKNEKDIFSVMLEEGEANIPFILCNLQKPKITQSPLNLNFVSGDRVTFFCRGNATVHLTGYLITEDDDDFAGFGEEVEEEEEEEEEEGGEEVEEEEGSESETQKGKVKQNGLTSNKRKVEQPAKANKKKKAKIESQDSDASDVGEDEEFDEEESSEDLGSDEESEEEEDMVPFEDISEPESEEEKQPEPPQQKKKKNKKQKNQQQSPQTITTQQQGKQKQKQQQNGMTQPIPSPQKKKQGAEEKTETAAPAKKTLEGGVVVKDLKMGNGPVCKPGRMVSVYYVGRLKSNNKVFDQTTQGQGFKFRVGRGEVIKGWDVGLTGMKVGGKRLITCPPNMAYGQKGSPPTIPGNSTLMFEVELKAVN